MDHLAKIMQESVVIRSAIGLEDNAVAYGCPLVEGATYRYTASQPAKATGHLYKLVKEVLDVPSYQRKCLVECLTGPDRGLWFTCSLSNFAGRYEIVRDAVVHPGYPMQE